MLYSIAVMLLFLCLLWLAMVYAAEAFRACSSLGWYYCSAGC